MLLLCSFARADAQASVVADLLARINRERVTRGLAPYALNTQLTTAAQNHANEVVKTGKYGHVGADGSMAADRAARAGYGAYSWGRRIGENWANYHNPSTAMSMWMESAPHRNNILHALYREVGIGVAPSPLGTTLYVLVFGAQPNVLPVFVNDGAPRTNDLNVRLTLTSEEVAATGDGTSIGKPTLVLVSNHADFAGATWQAFTASPKWTLANEGNPKIVYVKYRDAKGRTVTSSASIEFGASTDAPALRAPVAQASATSTREAPTPLRVTPTLTRTAVPSATRMPSATPTNEPTATPSPTPTAPATMTLTPTPVATQTPWVVTATPNSQSRAANPDASFDPVTLGVFGLGLMLSVLAISNRLAK